MAKRCYNTFCVVDCRRGKILLVTSSARKAHDMLRTGRRVEVWNCNERVEKIYSNMKEKYPMQPYVNAEKEYHRKKQEDAGIWRREARLNV